MHHQNAIIMKTVFLFTVAQTTSTGSADAFSAPGLFWVAGCITAVSFLLGMWQLVRYFIEAFRINLEGIHLEDV